MSVTVNSMLSKIASAFSLETLDNQTKPTQTEALLYMNLAILDLVNCLQPRRLQNNVWTPGRIDKLIDLLEEEVVSDTGTPPDNIVGGPTECPLPGINGEAVCYYSSIEVRVDITPYYPATETSVSNMMSRLSGSPYAVDYTRPLYAWEDGKIYVLPSGYNSTYVRYNYIKKPESLDTGQTFPLPDDLSVNVIDLTLALLWGSFDDEASMALSQHYYKRYLKGVYDLLGESMSIVDRV